MVYSGAALSGDDHTEYTCSYGDGNLVCSLCMVEFKGEIHASGLRKQRLLKYSLIGKNYVKNKCNVCYNPKGGKIIILQKLRVWTIEMY